MKAAALARLLAIALVASSCAGTAPAGGSGAGGSASAPVARAKLVVAYTALSGNQLPAWVAKERGFFEQNGLDVDLQSVANGQLATGALLAGELQVAQIAIEPMQVDLTGSGDLVFIVAPQIVLPFHFYALPSIKDPADLKGKSVGITALGSVTNTAAKMALRSLKLDPDKDVQMVVLNSTPNVLTGLQGGAVQAGIMSSPTTIRAREAGMRELVDVSRLASFVTGWHVVSRKYLEANQDGMRRYTKAIVQAIAFEIRQPAETQQILGKYTSISDAAILKESYEEQAGQLRRTPVPDLQAVRNVLDELSLTIPAAKTAS